MMTYSIDELYNLFMWDNQLSNDENETKAQKGIDAAKQIKNLFPFIQPIIIPPEKSKLVWEPCAKVVAMRSDKELEPFMFILLEWIQDLNWPGAMIIYDRLTQIPYNILDNKNGWALNDFEHTFKLESQGIPITDYCKYRHSSYIAWDRIHPNQVGSTLMAREFLKYCDFDYNHGM